MNGTISMAYVIGCTVIFMCVSPCVFSDQKKEDFGDNIRRETRLDGGVAGDVRIVQVLDHEELEKIDWDPGEGAIPLTPGKAISQAVMFCEEKLHEKVHLELRELSLISLSVNGVRRWYWLVKFPAYDTEEEIKGRGNPVAIPVSLSGTVMAEVQEP